MRIIDTKGQACPAPLIAAKRALIETGLGESFILLTDNQTTFNNLSRFLKDNNADFQVSQEGEVWRLLITKTVGVNAQLRAEDYCPTPISHFEKGNFVIAIASDKMGEGDDQLGHLLMSNFIMAIKDLNRLPKKILFYNKGVSLVTTNSPVIEHIIDLEKMGVEILLCATCINHFCLEKSVGAGALSNMYEIAEVMVSSANVIRP